MSIKISPKHGLNVSLMKCYFCGGACGVALLGRLKGDEEAPSSIMSREPCETCEGYMLKGVILIAFDPDLTLEQDDPYRTGRVAVVKDEALFKLMRPGPARDEILQRRFAFVDKNTWGLVGLPTVDVN